MVAGGAAGLWARRRFEANVPDTDDYVVGRDQAGPGAVNHRQDPPPPSSGCPATPRPRWGPPGSRTPRGNLFPVGGRVERRRRPAAGWRAGPGPGRPGQRRRAAPSASRPACAACSGSSRPRWPRLRGPARARPVRPWGQRPRSRAHRRRRGAAARRDGRATSPGDMYTPSRRSRRARRFLGYASREAGPACGSAGRCRTRSTAPRCTPDLRSRPTKRPAPCWPAWATRSRDIGMPLGPDVGAVLRGPSGTAYATLALAPLAPEQEEVLLPLTPLPCAGPRPGRPRP